LNEEIAMPQHDDGQDDVSALTFFSSPGDAGDSGADESLGALRAQASDQREDTTTDVDALRSATGSDTDDGPEVDLSEFVVKVTNVPGTVSASALFDGSLQQIELSPKVAGMSEAALADEILVIADLARQKGLASQHEMIAEAMEASDPEGDGALVMDALGLPTLQQAAAAQAEVFAARYATDAD
jgi:hypothetical protein